MLSKSICFNVRFNTEPRPVVQTILTHGGPEIIFDKLKLVIAPLC